MAFNNYNEMYTDNNYGDNRDYNQVEPIFLKTNRSNSYFSNDEQVVDLPPTTVDQNLSRGDPYDSNNYDKGSTIFKILGVSVIIMSLVFVGILIYAYYR